MEYTREILEKFKYIPLFEALDNSQFKQIFSSAQKIVLPAKTTLFEMNTQAKHFYILQSGQVKLFCISDGGDEKIIEIILPHQSFGEAIMFLPKQIYPVSAETISDSEIYRFDAKLFRNLLENSTETNFRLLGIMARHLHSKINEINNLTLHNATYRLVVYLLNQLPEDATELSDIHLNTTKSIIASRLSIQPETFSRILLRISKQGLIKVKGNNITLLDVEGLQKLLSVIYFKYSGRVYFSYHYSLLILPHFLSSLLIRHLRSR